MHLNLPNSFFGFYSASYKATLDLMNAWLQGAQRVRKLQLEHIGVALSDYQNNGTQSDPVRDAFNLQAMQQAVVRCQVQRGTAIWSDMVNTLRQNQFELADQMRNQAHQLAEVTCQSINEMPLAILPPPVASSLHAIIKTASMEMRNAQERTQACMGMSGLHHAPRQQPTLLQVEQP